MLIIVPVVLLGSIAYCLFEMFRIMLSLNKANRQYFKDYFKQKENEL